MTSRDRHVTEAPERKTGGWARRPAGPSIPAVTDPIPSHLPPLVKRIFRNKILLTASLFSTVTCLLLVFLAFYYHFECLWAIWPLLSFNFLMDLNFMYSSLFSSPFLLPLFASFGIFWSTCLPAWALSRSQIENNVTWPYWKEINLFSLTENPPFDTDPNRASNSSHITPFPPLPYPHSNPPRTPSSPSSARDRNHLCTSVNHSPKSVYFAQTPFSSRRRRQECGRDSPFGSHYTSFPSWACLSVVCICFL